jgi:DHA1 family inner membrane transport protein
VDELAGTTESGLPLALYALALGTFALGTTELVIVGLLPEISGDRGDLVFAVASFSGSAALVVEVVGALITCAAFV